MFLSSFIFSHINVHYSDVNGKYTYSLNLCGPLVTPCTTNATSAACQSAQSTNVSLGLPSSALTLSDGQVSVQYKGGQYCSSSKANRTTTISFVCDPTQTGKQGPLFALERPSCSYFFNWRTSLVCSKSVQTTCVIDIPSANIYYDLTPMRLTSANWIVTDPATGLKFELSMCQSLLPDNVRST
jgi:hypothetical protein